MVTLALTSVVHGLLSFPEKQGGRNPLRVLPTGLHPRCLLPFPGSLLAATRASTGPPAVSLQLQAPIRFPFLDRPRFPGDEFPHYLRDLHIGHVPHGPECPGRVWRATAGRCLSATYRQALGS